MSHHELYKHPSLSGFTPPLKSDLDRCLADKWLKRKGWKVYSLGGKLVYQEPSPTTTDLYEVFDAVARQMQEETK